MKLLNSISTIFATVLISFQPVYPLWQPFFFQVASPFIWIVDPAVLLCKQFADHNKIPKLKSKQIPHSAFESSG